VIVINKCDLLPYVDFRVEEAKRNIRKENPRGKIFEVAAKTGAGFDRVYRHLEKELNVRKSKNKN